MATSNQRSKPICVHLIGIAGSGMTGLAMCLHDLHFIVTGSDPQYISPTGPLSKLGIRIFTEHTDSNVHQSDYVIYSDAVDSSNIELVEARLLNIPTLSRAQAMTQLLAQNASILVAGSHGKSTTSAMITTILKEMGHDPSYLIGAEVISLGSKRGHIGNGTLFIGEACEAYENLIHYLPMIAVITNIDDEHIEHYGSQTRLDRAFVLFANRATKGVVINNNDPGVRRIAPQIQNKIISFGTDHDSDVSAQEIQINRNQSSFDLYIFGKFVQTISIPIPGIHIVQNALAAIASLVLSEVCLDLVANSLLQYQGAVRRWQKCYEDPYLCIIDDYAHHPVEIRALRLAARAMMNDSERLVIAFQPQLFSRTKRKAKEFADELALFDEIWLLEIDGGSESNPDNITSEVIHNELHRLGSSAKAVASPYELVRRLPAALKKNDVVLIVGAGSIAGSAKQVADYLNYQPNRLALKGDYPPTIADQHNKYYQLSKSFISPISALYPGVLRYYYEQICKQPHALALITPTQRLTYQQLNNAANATATFLRSKGIRKADVVAVQVSISVELIVLLIALQKLGAIYLPLDTQLPPKRSAYQIDAANAQLWITQEMQLGPPTKNFTNYLDLAYITQQIIQANTQPQFFEEISVQVGEDECAYICFTSGSTGKPKGVVISHQSLSNFVLCGIQSFAINSKSRFIANTSIGFDVSLGEIWMTLCGGAQLAIPEQERPLVGSSLAQFLESYEITHLAITPSLLATIPSMALPKLQCIICAGETPSHAIINQWANQRSFFNAYGPTEATIYVSIALCKPDSPIRIGNPISQLELTLIDSDGYPIEGPGIGELCISGRGLMQHYLNADKNEGFIEIALGSDQPKRYYRTGDVIERHTDGSLEYLCRRDSQIKINGIRIELTEIEEALLQQSTIADAVVCLDQSIANPLLIGFVVLKSKSTVDWFLLKKKLSEWLPQAMIPNQFIQIRSIPLTLAGKKDRALVLTNYHRKKIRKNNYSAPRNSIEQQLADIWKSILRSEFDISVTEEFQWLGGDSVQFLELISQIEALFQIEIPPGYLGNRITIENLAIKVAELLWQHDQQDPAKNEVSFRSSRVYKGLRDLTSLWQGERIDSSSIIVSQGMASADYDLFICVQNEYEYRSIALALGKTFRVHAMRSGHLLMDYSPETIRDLAKYYVSELRQILPTGKILIGGICQGGAIATEMANILIDEKVNIEYLLLIDQARLPTYLGKIAFIYSSKGSLNPYSRFEDPHSRFSALYGENYTLNLVNCEHGFIHVYPYVNQLNLILTNLVSKDFCHSNQLHSTSTNSMSNHGRIHLQIKNSSGAPSFSNAFQVWQHEKTHKSDAELIKHSALFDPKYYQSQLPSDITINPKDLGQHFTELGWQHDLDPSPLFNIVDYQQRYPEVLSETCNPLIHYLRKGMFQGKIPWSDARLLDWQGAMHQDPELAINIIANCDMPWLQLTAKHTVYLFAHSHGHVVFKQFQQLLSEGLTAIGVINHMVDEKSLIDRSDHAISLIIGPHEFFFLMGAKDPLEFNLKNTIVFNTEQLNSYWFARIFPILEKVRYVADINLQSAASLVKLGINARFLPLGYLPESELFSSIFSDRDNHKYKLDVAVTSDDSESRFYSVKREIDLLWIGSNSARRNNFLKKNKVFFENIKSFIRLLSSENSFNDSNSKIILPHTFLKLAHRSKIMLNVHHFENPYFEWARLVHYGLMQGCCVVTETSSHLPGLIPGVHYFEDEIQNLPSLIKWLINDPQGQQKLERVRRAGYQAALAQFQLSRSLAELFKIGHMPSTQPEDTQKL